MPPPLRDVPVGAIEPIKCFEGIPDGDPHTVNIDAYLCPAGVWTLGWGHAVVDGSAQLKGAAEKARARALYPKARVNGVLLPLAGLTRRRNTERAMFLGQDLARRWCCAGQPQAQCHTGAAAWAFASARGARRTQQARRCRSDRSTRCQAAREDGHRAGRSRHTSR